MSTAPPPTATGSSKLDAAKAQVAANANLTTPTGIDLYSRFALAGAVCCAVTHGALTPVDVYVLPPIDSIAASPIFFFFFFFFARRGRATINE